MNSLTMAVNYKLTNEITSDIFWQSYFARKYGSISDKSRQDCCFLYKILNKYRSSLVNVMQTGRTISLSVNENK